MRWSLLVVASLAACFNPSYERPACSTSGACPSGLQCVAGFCAPPAPEDAAGPVDVARPTDASGDADDGNVPLTIPAFAIILCPEGTTPGTCPVNHAPLSALNDADAGVVAAGAEITFVAKALSASSLFLDDLKLTGGPAGLHIEHPLFVSRPQGAPPVPDPIDRYFSLKLDIPPGETVALDGGTASFSGFSPSAMLEIRFTVVAPLKAGAPVIRTATAEQR